MGLVVAVNDLTDAEKLAGEILSVLGRNLDYAKPTLARMIERAFAEPQGGAAAHVWQEGWNQGFRDYQAAESDGDGKYTVVTPTPNPHQNALVVDLQSE